MITIGYVGLCMHCSTFMEHGTFQLSQNVTPAVLNPLYRHSDNSNAGQAAAHHNRLIIASSPFSLASIASLPLRYIQVAQIA